MNDTRLENIITTTNDSESPINSANTGIPNPEVAEKKRNRRYSAEYKLKVLTEMDGCASASERGAVMRREGLYSSLISEWRKCRDTGALSALNKLRGRKNKYDAKDEKIAALKNEMAALKTRLAQAEAIIDVQKKLSSLLATMPEADGSS